MEEKRVGTPKPWLSFYDEGVPATMDYPEIRLDQLLADSAAKHPGQPAIIFGARVGSRIMDAAMSYRQLDDAVNRFAAALQRLGVKQGDRVAIFMPNCPQFVIAYYGIMRAGGIAVPCNFLYTADRDGAPVERCRRRDCRRPQPLLSQGAQHPRPDARLRHVIVTNIKEYFPSLLRLLFTLTKEKKGGHRVELASPDDLWFQSLLAGAAASAQAGRGRPAGHSLPALHRRDDGRAQGRPAHPPQPGVQRRGRPRLVPRARSGRRSPSARCPSSTPTA